MCVIPRSMSKALFAGELRSPRDPHPPRLGAYTVGEQILAGLTPSFIAGSLNNVLVAGPLIFLAVISADALLLHGVRRAIATVAFVVAAVTVSLAVVWKSHGGDSLWGLPK